MKYFAQCVFLLSALLWPGPVVSAQTGIVDAYFARAIWPGDGPAIVDAVLLVQDGKVLAIGPRDQLGQDIPANARRHHLSNQTLIPGLVIAQTALVESTNDSDYTLTPEVRAIDGFDPFDDFDRLLAAGITTVQLSPGSRRLMPGQGSVVKLALDDFADNPEKQILSTSESLRIDLTRDALQPPTIYEPPVGAVSEDRPLEPTRAQLGTSLAQAIVGLDALFTEANAAEAEQGEDALAALAQLLRNKIKLRFAAENGAEVQAALQLADKFQMKWLLVDPLDIAPLAAVDWTSERVVGVVLNPEFRPGRITNPSVPLRGQAPLPTVWERAKQLVAAGAGDKLAIRATIDADLDDLFFLAASFGRAGLSTEQILKMLTINPARMLGVENRVGSLRPGADADFVVLSAAPLTGSARVLATYSDGVEVFQAELSSESTLVTAAQVYTPTGIVTDGGVSINNGKIAGVGSSLTSPPHTIRKHFENAVIVPGLLDCQTSLGIGGNLGDQLPLNTKLAELLARDDDQIALARQGGVTMALLSSTRLPSPVIAFKFSDQPHSLKDPVAIRFEIQGNVTAAEASLSRTLATGKAYSDAWDKYDAEYASYQKQLKEYEAAKLKYDAAVKAAAEKAAAEKAAAEKAKTTEKGEAEKNSAETGKDTGNAENKPDEGKPAEKAESDASKPETKPTTDKTTTSPSTSDKAEPAKPDLKEPTKPEEPKKPKAVEALDPYRDLFHGRIAALVNVSDPRAVEIAVKLFRQSYDIRTAIVTGEAAVDNVALLAKHEVMVILGPTLVGERDGQVINYPAELSVAGIPLAFQSQASTGASELPDAIAFAVYQGLGRTEALNAMSRGPAEFFKLDTVGAIEVGRDADLVVLTGPPFEISSQVLAVMIDGRWVYEKESE